MAHSWEHSKFQGSKKVNRAGQMDDQEAITGKLEAVQVSGCARTVPAGSQ